VHDHALRMRLPSYTMAGSDAYYMRIAGPLRVPLLLAEEVQHAFDDRNGRPAN
jgi:hypothetical protein